MSISLSHSPSLTISPASLRCSDHLAIGRIHVRGWQVGYAGLIPAPYLSSLSVATKQDVWRSRLAQPAPTDCQTLLVARLGHSPLNHPQPSRPRVDVQNGGEESDRLGNGGDGGDGGDRVKGEDGRDGGDGVDQPENHTPQAVAAIGWIGVCRSRDGDAVQGEDGEVWGLYVDPDHWGKGAGKALLERGMVGLKERAFARVSLWVLADNHRARTVYEKSGFLVGTEKADVKTVEIGGARLEEVRYWKKL